LSFRNVAQSDEQDGDDPYPPEIKNLDRMRRELLDGMNRIDRMREKKMGERLEAH